MEEAALEELKSELLKLKLENTSLQEQNKNLKNTIFRKDLFATIDELNISTFDVDDEDFLDIIRFYYDKGGIEMMVKKLKEMFNIQDPPKAEKSFDPPPEIIKYMDKYMEQLGKK